jgi:hypothetical protein
VLYAVGCLALIALGNAAFRVRFEAPDGPIRIVMEPAGAEEPRGRRIRRRRPVSRRLETEDSTIDKVELLLGLLDRNLGRDGSLGSSRRFSKSESGEILV